MMVNCAKKLSKAITLSLAVLCSSNALAENLGKMKMGIEPWLGYGLWHIAAQDKLFKKEGFENVDIVNFAEDKDINAALASGQIDVANIATHTAMGMISAGLPIKVIMLLDQSETADALITSDKIKSLKDLKGKRVAYEEGTTSDILLHSALSSIGLTIKDIIPVPMPASNAGSALIAGQVPVAVTYEPYLTAAKNNDASIKMLYSGASDPGLISDVLVVRQSVIDKHPEQITALIDVWAKSLKEYNNNTKRGREIISKAVGASPEELSTAFDGVEYLDIPTNKSMLDGEFKNKTFPHILKAANEANIISADLTFKQVVDPSFIETKE
ncbi:ABC transporter substrate-binding protein [Vibrio salinus]|uniref:ABC transporter substrate-binding protein n=1 Tax=Vibrio salinus TaxID=2899784 RepID=UPI001E4B119B|nr:ABC transporter substrate-binding protein [Vibrio salinus]MCE0492781.1 ABC transporter substrate-binding protein [Vibrio salinus]